MRIWPSYKIFSFKRIPLFIDDEGGPRARPWVKIAACVTIAIVWIYIAIEKF